MKFRFPSIGLNLFFYLNFCDCSHCTQQLISVTIETPNIPLNLSDKKPSLASTTQILMLQEILARTYLTISHIFIL